MMRVSRRSILSRCAAAALMLPASWLAYPDTRASAQAAPRDGAITVDGRTIHYLDWGPEDRPALFMVHAFDRSAHSYDHVAPLLNQRQPRHRRRLARTRRFGLVAAGRIRRRGPRR
jgi:hypothetical protein